MAISAAMIWEVRTTGADTNGGGFRGGAYATSTPSAPSLSQSGTGGSVAAGTYYIVITHRDGNGETGKSAQSSVTTTGGSSTITVTAPTNPNVQGSTWNVYVGTATGGPYYSQTQDQAQGSNVTITSTPPTSGTQAPGTDYSQQDAAQVTVNGTTINGTSSGATATMTLSGYTPTAADVGNTVRVATGTNATAGVYEIVGWSSTTWVLDSNWCTGAVTSCTAKMGGGLATPGQANGSKVSYNKVFIKSGTYTISSGISDTNQGSHWVGYSTHRTVENTDTAPTWDAGANSITLLTTNFQTAYVANIAMTNSGAHTSVTGLVISGSNCRARLISCTSLTASQPIQVTGSTLDSCSIISGGGFNISSGFLMNCVVSAGGGSLGAYQIQGGCTLYRCVAINCTNNGADFQYSGSTGNIVNCLSYGNQSGTAAGGFQINGQIGFLYNCVAYHCSGIGFSCSSPPALSRYINCAAGDCTQGNLSTGANMIRDTQLLGFISLSASPFTNAASKDFSLNSTAGGGTALKAAGYEATWPVLSTTGYEDVGLAQHQASGGGGAILSRAFLGMGGRG